MTIVSQQKSIICVSSTLLIFKKINPHLLAIYKFLKNCSLPCSSNILEYVPPTLSKPNYPHKGQLQQFYTMTAASFKNSVPLSCTGKMTQASLTRSILSIKSTFPSPHNSGMLSQVFVKLPTKQRIEKSLWLKKKKNYSQVH